MKLFGTKREGEPPNGVVSFATDERRLKFYVRLPLPWTFVAEREDFDTGDFIQGRFRKTFYVNAWWYRERRPFRPRYYWQMGVADLRLETLAVLGEVVRKPREAFT